MVTKSKYAVLSSSKIFVFALIASSLFIVNCNNAPAGRAGAKAKTVSNGNVGKTDKPKPTDISTKNPSVKDIKTQECSTEILNSYQVIADDIKTNSKDQKISKENAEKAIVACTDFAKAFKTMQADQCHYFDAKDLKKTKQQFLDRSPEICRNVAKILKDEYQTDTEYLKFANNQSKIKLQQEKQKFIGQKFTISEDMKAMLKQDSLNFKMYIVDGEIKTDTDELSKNFKDKKVICSFVEPSTEIDKEQKFQFTVLNADETIATKDLPDNFKALKIIFLSETEDKKTESHVLQMLACTNLLNDKVDFKLFKKAFGQHLIDQN